MWTDPSVDVDPRQFELPDIPELAPIVVVSEDDVALRLRTDRGGLAQLALRVRTTESEVARLERELTSFDAGVASVDPDGVLDELRSQIDAIRAGVEADLRQSRVVASERMTTAIEQATRLVSVASESLERLARSLGERHETGVIVVPPGAPVGAVPVPTADVAPIASPAVVVPIASVPDVPVPLVDLLTPAELESHIDALEARAARRRVAPNASQVRP